MDAAAYRDFSPESESGFDLAKTMKKYFSIDIIKKVSLKDIGLVKSMNKLKA